MITRNQPTLSDTSVRQASEYLSFRSFFTGFKPTPTQLTKVATFSELANFIEHEISLADSPALLLSGGMDSAVLAPYMPRGSTAYTVYHPKIERTEVAIARSYAEKFELVHKVIEMDLDQYFEVMNGLMVAKKMPLSPAEPVLHILALHASKDGHSHVVTGGGADTKQGGFPRLRKHRWQNSYQKKLQKLYLDSSKVLQQFSDISHVLSNYVLCSPIGKIVDTKTFLREIGTERFAFENAVTQAGVSHIAPFDSCDSLLDMRMNRALPKYFIQKFYRQIYGRMPPQKFGLQKPSFALKDYHPERDEFNKEFDYEGLDYNRKFLIYSLERFMNEVGFSDS